MGRDRILAAGFITDAPGEGSIFPSAGGRSDDPRVQAVYWRCIVVFYLSARLNNPHLRLQLYTNREPPQLDGRSVRRVLERFGVEILMVPLTHRLARPATSSWGNVLYFLDVMEHFCESGEDDAGFVLMDCDVIVTRDVDSIFAPLDTCSFVGYSLDTPPDEAINGVTRVKMSRISRSMFGDAAAQPVRHFGGELFGATRESWKRHRALFHELYRLAASDAGECASIYTEEHFFSIVFGGIPNEVHAEEALLKRMWTSRQYSNVEPGDQNHALWHLPAEKRYGLKYLYEHFSESDFRIDIAPGDFRALAQRACGIPGHTIAKHLRDNSARLRMLMGGR